MHPKIKAWIDAKNSALLAIKAARQALEDAETAEPPTNMRPATALDVQVGEIFWYLCPDEPDAPYWKMIVDVLCPGHPYKAYHAHDGCRYGLEGAMVEIYNAEHNPAEPHLGEGRC